jgi:hypothetical protein
MRLVCAVTVYSTVVREFRAARSTRGGPSGPKWPATDSIRYYTTTVYHTNIDSLYIVMSPHPHIHPLVSIPVCIGVCAPRRAPTLRIVLVYRVLSP